jgi:hypothetical protein
VIGNTIPIPVITAFHYFCLIYYIVSYISPTLSHILTHTHCVFHSLTFSLSLSLSLSLHVQISLFSLPPSQRQTSSYQATYSHIHTSIQLTIDTTTGETDILVRCILAGGDVNHIYEDLEDPDDPDVRRIHIRVPTLNHRPLLEDPDGDVYHTRKCTPPKK